MISRPTCHLGCVPLLSEQPAKASMAMLGPRDGSGGELSVLLESGNMSSNWWVFPTRVKGLFCGMLGAWAGALETRIPEFGTLDSRGFMDSRIQGATCLGGYQAKEVSIQRKQSQRC